MPVELATGTALVAVPERADPRDVLVGARSLDALPAGARVGTSALRRRAQLLALRPDLEVVELRGNVDTRLRKLAAGEVDALVLAAAGLDAARPAGTRPAAAADRFVPAPGQGALALQARGDRPRRSTRSTTPRRGPALRGGARAGARARRLLPHAAGRARATGDGACAAFAGLPDGSEWLRDEVAGGTAEAPGAARASGCSPRARPTLLARRARRWRA